MCRGKGGSSTSSHGASPTSRRSWAGSPPPATTSTRRAPRFPRPARPSRYHRSAMERALRLFAGMLVFAVSASAGAQRVEAPEASVKAAFLYGFGGYVEWPARTGGAAEPFTIGVLDSDAVAQELEKLVPGRSIAGRPVAVRRLRHGEPVAGLQLLFAGGPTPERDAI